MNVLTAAVATATLTPPPNVAANVVNSGTTVAVAQAELGLASVNIAAETKNKTENAGERAPPIFRQPTTHQHSELNLPSRSAPEESDSDSDSDEDAYFERIATRRASLTQYSFTRAAAQSLTARDATARAQLPVSVLSSSISTNAEAKVSVSAKGVPAAKSLSAHDSDSDEESEEDKVLLQELLAKELTREKIVIDFERGTSNSSRPFVAASTNGKEKAKFSAVEQSVPLHPSSSAPAIVVAPNSTLTTVGAEVADTSSARAPDSAIEPKSGHARWTALREKLLANHLSFPGEVPKKSKAPPKLLPQHSSPLLSFSSSMVERLGNRDEPIQEDNE